MKILFFVIGLILGILQLFLTKKTVDCLTEKNNSRLLAFIIIKLAMYAGALSVMFILMRAYLVYFGIGFGAGMIISAFANFIITVNKDKSNKEGDDTP